MQGLSNDERLLPPAWGDGGGGSGASASWEGGDHIPTDGVDRKLVANELGSWISRQEQVVKQLRQTQEQGLEQLRQSVESQLSCHVRTLERLLVWYLDPQHHKTPMQLVGSPAPPAGTPLGQPPVLKAEAEPLLVQPGPPEEQRSRGRELAPSPVSVQHQSPQSDEDEDIADVAERIVARSRDVDNSASGEGTQSSPLPPRPHSCEPAPPSQANLEALTPIVPILESHGSDEHVIQETGTGNSANKISAPQRKARRSNSDGAMLRINNSPSYLSGAVQGVRQSIQGLNPMFMLKAPSTTRSSTTSKVSSVSQQSHRSNQSSYSSTEEDRRKQRNTFGQFGADLLLQAKPDNKKKPRTKRNSRRTDSGGSVESCAVLGQGESLYNPPNTPQGSKDRHRGEPEHGKLMDYAASSNSAASELPRYASDDVGRLNSLDSGKNPKVVLISEQDESDRSQSDGEEGEDEEGRERSGVGRKTIRFSDWEAELRAKNLSGTKDVEIDHNATEKVRIQNQNIIAKMISNKVFDYVIALVLISNALVLGYQVDHAAADRSVTLPVAFQIIDAVYCLIFVTEVVIRIVAHGPVRFFRGARFVDEWKWNWFDFAVVAMQVAETAINFHTLGQSTDSLANYLVIGRLARFARMVRVVRVIRVMRCFRGFRILLTMIFGTMKNGMWAALLMFLIMYIFGIIFTQATTEYLMEYHHHEIMEIYYGTLPRSILTLFMCIIGGVDWEVVIRPLSDLSQVYVGVFLVYMVVVQLVVMNVVTGLFLQSAIEQAQADQEHVIQLRLAEKVKFVQRLHELFEELDSSHDGTISLDEFEEHLKNDRMQALIQTFEIDNADAWTLFKLLDSDGGGSVDIEEFVDGCIRLKGSAKSIQMAQVMYHHKWIMDHLVDLADYLRPVCRNQQLIISKLDKMDPPTVGKQAHGGGLKKIAMDGSRSDGDGSISPKSAGKKKIANFIVEDAEESE